MIFCALLQIRRDTWAKYRSVDAATEAVFGESREDCLSFWGIYLFCYRLVCIFVADYKSMSQRGHRIKKVFFVADNKSMSQKK
jgi:hypothetical protein